MKLIAARMRQKCKIIGIESRINGRRGLKIEYQGVRKKVQKSDKIICAADEKSLPLQSLFRATFPKGVPKVAQRSPKGQPKVTHM